jgi:hypothetical protein
MLDEQQSVGKQLSNPFSTGGGGPRFENQVQTLFVVLMLTGGVVPCLPPLPIKKIKLQGHYDGYNTDDFIAFVEGQSGEQKAKLLAQIKHSVSITENDSVFADVIKAAWSDFNDAEVFDSTSDVFALITGPLSATDGEARVILEWARTSETAEEFLKKVNLGKFSSVTKQNKLGAFRAQLKKANGVVDVGDERLWQFLKSFHLLPCDLDISSGFVFSFLRSSIAQFTNTEASGVFDLVAREVASFNQNAGTLTRHTVSQEIQRIFSQRVHQIPQEYVPESEVQSVAAPPDYSKSQHADALTFASLFGAWNEKVEGDREAIRKLIEGND